MMRALAPAGWRARLERVHPALRRRLGWLLAPLTAYGTRTRLDALRKDVGQFIHLSPVAVVRNREEFLAGWREAHRTDPSERYAELLRTAAGGKLHLQRFCLCCGETTRMLVDFYGGEVDAAGARVPNWRERLVCTRCGMNNRQRLVAKLIDQAARRYPQASIYLMEQVTPIFEWVKGLHGSRVQGSEYLGHTCRGGTRVGGIRHEDVMNLSFADASFDVIVSNDVLEHVPDPERALRECLRVLKPGGTMLATFPFHDANETTIVRAMLADDGVRHLQPPRYHGNPVSSGGSLVYQDFGWDLLDLMHRIGFSSAACEMYLSDAFGHLGMGLLVFRLTKAGEPAPA